MTTAINLTLSIFTNLCDVVRDFNDLSDVEWASPDNCLQVAQAIEMAIQEGLSVKSVAYAMQRELGVISRNPGVWNASESGVMNLIIAAAFSQKSSDGATAFCRLRSAYHYKTIQPTFIGWLVACQLQTGDSKESWGDHDVAVQMLDASEEHILWCLCVAYNATPDSKLP